MTTRFKREGPQKYGRVDPHKHIPFADEEDVPRQMLVWGCLWFAFLLLMTCFLLAGGE